ncbi:GxxExxY protein [Gemmatimonas sp.]|uniref:GxxExxY protein n=1 Tax=Gemmatimonas sp. TaxID=1962908 RepID=UPI0039834B0F
MALIPVHAEITGSIVDAAILLHRDLGPSLLESTYEVLLQDELERRGHRVQAQVVVPLVYRGRSIEKAFRLDLLVDHVIVIEVKSTERSAPVHRMQVLTYLRLMRLQVGLVLNFGFETMKAGIDRVYNDREVP